MSVPVKLVASLIIKNEMSRYLEPCIRHLLGFCDEVVIWDNGSTEMYDEDGRPTRDPSGQPWEIRLMGAFGEDGRRVLSTHDPDAAGGSFVDHARQRQRLLDLTLEREPTHILAIDADEFVTDGARVRAACEDGRYGAWGLCMMEVWNASPDGLEVRQDGGWVEHDVAMLWSPIRVPGPFEIVDRGPATGRTPSAVRHTAEGHTCSGVLHFGWTSRAERQARHDRYVVADGGRFHAKAHLDSILLPDDRIRLAGCEWPAALAPYRDRILAHANAGVSLEGDESDG